MRSDRGASCRGWGAAFGLLLTVACASAPASPERFPPTEYAPLAVGNRWTYAVRFPGQSGERTVEIERRDEDGYFVDDAGGALRWTPNGLRDRDRYLIRTPLEEGRTWRAVVSPSAVERYELRSVGIPCASRAGRFSDCLVVTSRLRRDDRVTLRVEFTWARGVGLAKVETIAEIAGEGDLPQTEQSLVWYQVGTREGGRAPSEPAAPAREPADERGPPDTWER